MVNIIFKNESIGNAANCRSVASSGTNYPIVAEIIRHNTFPDGNQPRNYSAKINSTLSN